MANILVCFSKCPGTINLTKNLIIPAGSYQESIGFNTRVPDKKLWDDKSKKVKLIMPACLVVHIG
jgi:hypothetical protein